VGYLLVKLEDCGAFAALREIVSPLARWLTPHSRLAIYSKAVLLELKHEVSLM